MPPTPLPTDTRASCCGQRLPHPPRSGRWMGGLDPTSLAAPSLGRTGATSDMPCVLRQLPARAQPCLSHLLLLFLGQGAEGKFSSCSPKEPAAVVQLGCKPCLRAPACSPEWWHAPACPKRAGAPVGMEPHWHLDQRWGFCPSSSSSSSKKGGFEGGEGVFVNTGLCLSPMGHADASE